MTRHVVISHPPLGVLGGGEAVAVWVAQSLNDDCEVTVLCQKPIDWSAIDERFATHLQDKSPEVVTWPPWMRAFLRLWPGEGDRWKHLFQEWLLGRLAKKRNEPIIWISTFNESRLPSAGFQYVHFPSRGQSIGVLGAVYQKCLQLVRCRHLVEPVEHLTAVNSQFTAAAWREMKGYPAEVIYPPVPALTAGLPWEQRSPHRMLCLGRLLPGKGLERAARIVKELRLRGEPMTLELVGAWCCSGRERRALERNLKHAEGLVWHGALSRAALARLVAQTRYGLHGMEGEPFGIAVAELQSAGCIVFAPEWGGPAEILANTSLLYRDEEDAVRKILAVLRSPERQQHCHNKAKERAEMFTPQRFMAAIRGVLASLSQASDASAVAAKTAKAGCVSLSIE